MFFHINHTAWQAATTDKSPFKCIEGCHVKICLQEVRELSLSGGFPRGSKKQSHWVAHPMKPIVSLMNRQDLIKTFQTSFGPQCGAKRLPRRAQLTPRWSEAAGLLLPLKGEPTNHSNAFSRGLSCRLCYPLSFPLSLVVKNSLDAVCIASSRMSLLMADCVGKGRFRRPEGIDGAPSVCWATFRGFDVCIRSQYIQTCSDYDWDTQVA